MRLGQLQADPGLFGRGRLPAVVRRRGPSLLTQPPLDSATTRYLRHFICTVNWLSNVDTTLANHYGALVCTS